MGVTAALAKARRRPGGADLGELRSPYVAQASIRSPKIDSEQAICLCRRQDSNLRHRPQQSNNFSDCHKIRGFYCRTIRFGAVPVLELLVSSHCFPATPGIGPASTAKLTSLRHFGHRTSSVYTTVARRNAVQHRRPDRARGQIRSRPDRRRAAGDRANVDRGRLGI